MSKNVVMTLAVIVAALAGWLVISLVAGTSVVSPSITNGAPSGYHVPSGPQRVQTTVEVVSNNVSTSVEVR